MAKMAKMTKMTDLEQENVNLSFKCVDLQQRLDVLGGRATDLERQLMLMTNKLHTLEMEKVQWESEKIKQQSIIALSIGDANKKNEGYVQEINRLRDKIKILSGE